MITSALSKLRRFLVWLAAREDLPRAAAPPPDPDVPGFTDIFLRRDSLPRDSRPRTAASPGFFTWLFSRETLPPPRPASPSRPSTPDRRP